MITRNYRGSRFEASDLPLLQAAWGSIDKLDEKETTVNLEVLSGKNYQRQIIAEYYGRKLGQAAYLLQVLMTSKVTKGMSWPEVADSMNSPLRFLREQIEQTVPDAEEYVSEGFIIPPRGAGAFGGESTEDGVVHIHQPLLQVIHRQPDGRLIELRAAGVAPLSHFMIDVHPVSFDDNNYFTVEDARKGWVVIPSPEELQEEL